MSDLNSCLMWEFSRPRDSKTQQSSHFRLFGDEWSLKMSARISTIGTDDSARHNFIVHLCSKYGKNITETDVRATCYFFAGKLAITRSERVYIRNSEQRILNFNISSKDLNNSASSWIICCRINSFDTLSLQIDSMKMLSYERLPRTYDRSVQAYVEIPSSLQQLSDDFTRLLEDKLFPDATLTCSDHTWRIHRAVLTSRSEVFARMFRSGTAGKETRVIHIEDLDYPVMHSLLKYVYSGKVSGINVLGLYEAADKYAMPCLRKACSNWMAETLSTEICLGYLVMADAHSDSELKKAVIEFVNDDDHFAQIEKSDWVNFRKEHPFLAIEVLECFAPFSY